MTFDKVGSCFILSVLACVKCANLNVVALVIHDHAGTHVPVQYIQALLVQLEHTHGMRTLGP